MYFILLEAGSLYSISLAGLELGVVQTGLELTPASVSWVRWFHMYTTTASLFNVFWSHFTHDPLLFLSPCLPDPLPPSNASPFYCHVFLCTVFSRNQNVKLKWSLAQRWNVLFFVHLGTPSPGGPQTPFQSTVLHRTVAQSNLFLIPNSYIDWRIFSSLFQNGIVGNTGGCF